MNDVNKIFESIHDIYESHDGGGIWLSDKEKLKGISSNDIDSYRGTIKGCTIYLKNGNVIYSTMLFEEVHEIFNL